MGLGDAFRDAAHMRQERAFDAFRNREEEENLRAWERVEEIAEQLQHDNRLSCRRQGEELQRLARQHISIALGLGFSEDASAFVTTASGVVIEVDDVENVELEEAIIPSNLQAASPDGAPVAETGRQVIPEMIDSPVRSSVTDVATFKHLCDGRDGKLCLFEDAQGHLVAVRASRLA